MRAAEMRRGASAIVSRSSQRLEQNFSWRVAREPITPAERLRKAVESTRESPLRGAPA